MRFVREDNNIDVDIDNIGSTSSSISRDGHNDENDTVSVHSGASYASAGVDTLTDFEGRSSRHSAASSFATSATYTSLPSIQTSHPSIQSSVAAAAAASMQYSNESNSNDKEGNHNQPTGSDATTGPSVSSDQERQILLLMLLAQVCSMHDPTPRTFTVHVLELFERGILDRGSIQFLFELGLVPSLSPSRALLTNGPAAAPACSRQLVIKPVLSEQQLRSHEASAIRSRLAQHEQQENSSQQHAAPAANMDGDGSDPNPTQPWDVEHFPLSLSRYQREFSQVSLLNAGSFGQVYHAKRKMDGCDYAIKKITFDATGYSNETIKQVVREVQCLATVNDHPNIVQYYTSWLEPSWMTGSPSVAIDNTSNLPQHKLLTDLQQQLLINSGGSDKDDVDNNNNSGMYKGSSSYLHGDDISSSFGVNHRRRRFSFDSSVAASDQSWDGYNFDNSRGAWGHSYDDSCLMSDSGGHYRDRHGLSNNRKQSPKKRASSSSYRYQISLYIQMQLCHPATLVDWIRERNRHVPETAHEQRIAPAMDIFRQIVSGMVHVHKHGIIHRDLKPANIFASQNGRVIKIGDFGLSKQLLHAAHENKNPSNEKSPHSGKTTEAAATTTAPASPSPSKAATVTATTVSSPQPTKPPPIPENHDGGDVMAQHPHKHNDEYWHNNAVIVRANRNLSATMATVASNQNALVGLRHQHQHQPPLTAGIGTASYASPEQVKSSNYGTAADIFSLGLILLELVCCFETEHERLHNFQQCRRQEQKRQKKIDDDDENSEARRVPSWLSQGQYKEIAAMILACTRPDPKRRPTAEELLIQVDSIIEQRLAEVKVNAAPTTASTTPTTTATTPSGTDTAAAATSANVASIPPTAHGTNVVHNLAGTGSTAKMPEKITVANNPTEASATTNSSSGSRFHESISSFVTTTNGAGGDNSSSSQILSLQQQDQLKCELLKKEEELQQHKDELAEKEKIIEKLRMEMEQMMASTTTTDNVATASATATSPDASNRVGAASTARGERTCDGDGNNIAIKKDEQIIVEEATSFQD